MRVHVPMRGECPDHLMDLNFSFDHCFDEEQGLRDICVTFESLFRLILHFFFSVIDYID